MQRDGEGFPLTVSVPAEQWGFSMRRLRYLEAVIVQILKDGGRLKEWYTASELAALGLRGMPHTRQGVSRLATAQRWQSRIMIGRGGERYEYHCASLPDRAFDDLVERILGLPADGEVQDTAPVAPAVARPVTAAPAGVAELAPPSNTAPPWVLPLLRIMRGKPALTVDGAVRELPRHLPYGVTCPSADQVRLVLDGLGVALPR